MDIKLITNGFERHAALFRTRVCERCSARFLDEGTEIALGTDSALGAPEKCRHFER